MTEKHTFADAAWSELAGLLDGQRIADVGDDTLELRDTSEIRVPGARIEMEPRGYGRTITGALAHVEEPGEQPRSIDLLSGWTTIGRIRVPGSLVLEVEPRSEAMSDRVLDLMCEHVKSGR